MSLEAPTKVEAFGESYHRVYVPLEVRADSQYPFADGQEVRARVIGPALLFVPACRSHLTSEIARVVQEEIFDA